MTGNERFGWSPGDVTVKLVSGAKSLPDIPKTEPSLNKVPVSDSEKSPTLSQVQIIQSLGEALAWFEKEIAWGVAPAELNHLTGRIGELYAAMITRGQMALATNQRGYDVVSSKNERISVKTVTSSHVVSFNSATLHLVDRVMILRINVDDERGVSVEEILDASAVEARAACRDANGKLLYPLLRTAREVRPIEDLKVTDSAIYGDFMIARYESGAVRILRDGVVQTLNIKAFLRPIAAELGVSLYARTGELYNTQMLGRDVIRALNALLEGRRK